MLMQSASAQTKAFVLKGQIKDASGNGIENALIKSMQNPQDFTSTSHDGIFILNSSIPIQSVEVIRQNYNTQVFAVNGKTFIEVILVNQISNTDSLRLKLVENNIPFPERVLVKEQSDQTIGRAIEKTNFGAVNLHETVTNNWSRIDRFDGAPLPVLHNESYSKIAENGFQKVNETPLSTFSIDVDRASYSNIRRFINNGSLPPVDAVRVEEMINYFDYNYQSPPGKHPVIIYNELASAPWNPEHKLLQIGIKAKEMDKENLPASNLVFLIDVSGSMNAPNKLPLLKSAMKMLVNELRAEDKVAIAVYAGAAGLVLESTSGKEKDKIIAAIDRLSAGGSTAGGAGINLAYSTAMAHFIKEGNNRVILATDGDFNVGASSDADMQTLIEAKRKQGVFLTVLGFGMGNYKDSKMEILADKGNGNYAYIDNISEAKKTLVSEFGSTLFTVAKDVKIQVEFNPANVAAYRLIGYENRKLKDEDFNDDQKDAGEMGAGHVVTALYEIVPVGVSYPGSVDPLKYQTLERPKSGVLTDELATIKLRYKAPDSDQSVAMNSPVLTRDSKVTMSDNLKWSAAVAMFGMLLRNSPLMQQTTYSRAISLAESCLGKDLEGYRRECLALMKNAQALSDNYVIEN